MSALPQSTPGAQSTNRVLFRHDWDARPRYETQQEGVFVGRRQLLERLASDFISKRSGTILISGVRGVGKTALVDKALLEARNKLQYRHVRNGLAYVQQSWSWWVLSRLVRNPAQWFEWFNREKWRRMLEASGSQLFVLKFNASDIGGAMAEPGQDALSGKPQVNPEKLLRALIRKLFMTCHSSRPTPEAEILRWSLRPKKHQQRFFETLENAYRKSVSKAYKEVISSSLNEAIKQSQSFAYEWKINWEHIIGLLACLAVGFGAAWAGSMAGWKPIQMYTAGGAAAMATYFTLTWTIKRSRETTSDRARQAQFSYEFDYSLAQMEYDLQAIMRALNPPGDGAFDPYRCFRRTIVIFDELDKLEDPVRQLNDVITHFKNFFTLSEALFVFITDHQFYEHLSLETAKAQRKRQYSPEHTFFTQKIYLRKPEFQHFHETLYRFCESSALLQAAASDADVTDYIVQNQPERFAEIAPMLSLETLTQLVIDRQRYTTEQRNEIEHAFEIRGGGSNPLSLARIWNALVTAGAEPEALAKAAEAFGAAGGWDDPDALAFLYNRRTRFGEADCARIEQHSRHLRSSSLRKYTSVEEAPFTLTDLARALCFQTRNHYFDLYFFVYDYVGSYTDGAPVLHMEADRFAREQRLWSRYQRMVEAGFYNRREDHPSQEYFNALLMESLYAVFDSRTAERPVKLREICFSVEKAAVAAPPLAFVADPLTPGTGAAPAAVSASDPTASLITPRDAERINEAILRLFRLLVARKAVTAPPALEQKLKLEDLELAAVADMEFKWNDDCEPVITQEGIELEPYERELIAFWDQNRGELEALDVELEKLWEHAQAPAGSAGPKLRASISRLRKIAEGLRNRTLTISRPDASALKADIGTSESLLQRVCGFVLERIRAEGGAEVVLSAKDAPADMSFRALMDLRRSEVDAMAKLPLRAIVYPQESECLMYLLTGPLDAKSLEQFLPKQDAKLFWYAPGKEPSELSAYPGFVHFYFPEPQPYYAGDSGKLVFLPSVSKLFTDYEWLARVARLQHMAALSRGQEHRDRGLALRAGAELVGPFFAGSEVASAFKEIGPDANWSVDDAVSALRQRINAFLHAKLEAAGITDPSFESHIVKEFVPWFLRAVEELATTQKADLRQAPSLIAAWAADLERSRQSLKSARTAA